MMTLSRRLGRSGVCLIVIFSLSFLGTISLATTFQRLTLEELVRRADLVVRGRVREIASHEAPDRSVITTAVILFVEEQWKGPKVSGITLEYPGGSAGGITLRVTDIPQFSRAEEVILFLKQHEDGQLATIGGKQGKFTIKTDLQSGRAMVEDLTSRKQDMESFLQRLREIVGN